MVTSKAGFWGVYPMVYALFDNNGRLNRELMRTQVRALLRHNVHGIAALGLATEVKKLSSDERRTLMAWVAEDVNGQVPLSVTVAEPSVDGQVDFIRAAVGLGAKWANLQPPHVKSAQERACQLFWCRCGPLTHPARHSECAGVSRDRLV